MSTSYFEGDMKSHESILLELAISILKDAIARTTANESANRDIQTLTSRYEHEGLSFLTITLPSFGQDFERSLANGAIDPSAFRSFRKAGAIPAFLQGMLGQVFSADTGRILNEPSVHAVEGIRQVVYAFKKLKLACAPKRVRKAFKGYIQDERDLNASIAPVNIVKFNDVVDHLWYWLARSPDMGLERVIPRHGPGATAEGISGNRKFKFSNWYSRLEPYFPMIEYTLGTLSAYDSLEFKEITTVRSDQELPVKVITVPKTLKAPRIIAIEPVCMQYTQQALRRALYKALESNWMTSGHVNFTDQTINQRIALMSSRDGSMATLDLSSASDRVPARLVYDMLKAVPEFRDAVFACRSKTAKLPTGEVIHLKKFASMGSALCFPIESMYFYTLCVGALLEKRGLPVTSRNAYSVSRDIYVYGDDIVVPADEAEFVVNYLQEYLCKVNMSKSFWSGNFRESCGMDAFQGRRVTPTYIREMPPDNKQSVSALISWCKTAGLLYKEGYYQASDYMYDVVERLLGKLPIVEDQCAGLGRLSDSRPYSIGRWNKRLQVPEVRTWVPSPVYRKDKLDGYPAFLKSILHLELMEDKTVQPSTSDERHLQRTARYGAVSLKRRWVMPY